MKIIKVVATDTQTNEKQIFTFGTANQGKKVVTSKGGRLNNYLEFVFKESTECVKDVDVEFDLDKEIYTLTRHHGEDGSAKTVLKKLTDGHWQVVARSHAVEYVENIINEQLADMLQTDYVNNKSVDNFHGDLTTFAEIKMLADVQQSVATSIRQANDMRNNAIRQVREYSTDQTVVTVDQLAQINQEVADLANQLAVATAQLGELKAERSVGSLRNDISSDLQTSQQKYNELISRKDEIEQARAQLKLRDDIDSVIPKVRQLRSVANQRAEYEKKRYGITADLEWNENELVAINRQLDEKERQYAISQDKRNRIEAINNELSYIASLYERNKKLNENLLELNEKQQRLTSEKVLYTNKLESLEKSITEVKQSLDDFHIPARSVGELLETVRVDVKIDEVNAQVEKLQSEISVKESQIAEKESTLVIQVKRFRSVAELDVAVTPIKAKDTILQVLDSKYNKLETINTSLQEKLRNLERAKEDYKYRILQLEQSRSKLEAERDKALLRKQEEFKREVFLNSQKVYSDDASSVFAVTANFHDQEMDYLDQELANRNLDRDTLIERAFSLEGAINEIKRHIEVNSAEMETLRSEKENINNRYNEIVAQNSSEAVFNYLKALNSDNGTKYLLDVQQDAVRSEAELAELKRYTEGMRVKLASLKSRLRYLKDTQSQLDDTQASIDTLVATNDKLKDELTDIGERLSAGYEQYKAISRQLESIESKLDDLRGAIIEVTKTIRVNEAQIAESTEKAKRYAGNDDLEQAVANFRYEIGDIESERQMLAESKQNTEKEVFRKRLELEKTQWLYESKCKEYDELYQELQFELNLKGLDMDKIESVDIDSNVEEYRLIIADYDSARKNLSERIDNLYNILQSQPNVKVDDKQIADKQQQVEQIKQQLSALEQQRKVQTELYVASNNQRIKVTAAAAQARTLDSLKETLVHNDIIGLLIRDKVKSTLSLATQYLNAITGGNYVVSHKDFKLFVTFDGEQIAYDNLPDNIKTAVYVATILSVPNTDTSAGRWLIFEERINIDKHILADMLLNVDNVSYVVDYTQTKGE